MKRIIRKLEPAIPKLPRLLRVAAYARVSSGKDAMLHSLSAQVSYYSKLIQNTPSWQYAGVYADEALSGTKDRRREFQRMLADCRAAGHAPLLCSSYRTQEKQTQLYNNLVQKQIARGNSRSEAMAKAAKEVAVPGTSEHQLGLAVDIVDTQNQVLNRAQEDTAVQQWLMEHCWEYGFILRYPPDKEEKTGIIYEPWHYRYVGREYAQAIRQSGLCLEEFLQR